VELLLNCRDRLQPAEQADEAGQPRGLLPEDETLGKEPAAASGWLCDLQLKRSLAELRLQELQRLPEPGLEGHREQLTAVLAFPSK